MKRACLKYLAFSVNSMKIITYAYYGKHISDLPSPATLAANIESIGTSDGVWNAGEGCNDIKRTPDPAHWTKVQYLSPFNSHKFRIICPDRSLSTEKMFGLLSPSGNGEKLSS
jgi:hypothetical protein